MVPPTFQPACVSVTCLMIINLLIESIEQLTNIPIVRQKKKYSNRKKESNENHNCQIEIRILYR